MAQDMDVKKIGVLAKILVGQAYASVLCGVLLPAPLAAQVPSGPELLALDDWGVFAAGVAKRVAAPDTSSGFREIPGDVTLIEETRDICASIGKQFGFRYHLTGAVPVSSLPLTIRIEHPSFAKWNGGDSAVDTFSTAVTPGQLHWTGWSFRDPKKLVNGQWRFNVIGQGRVLLDQRFRVRVGCTVPVS